MQCTNQPECIDKLLILQIDSLLDNRYTNAKVVDLNSKNAEKCTRRVEVNKFYSASLLRAAKLLHLGRKINIIKFP